MLLWLPLLLLLLFSILFADPNTRLSSSSACALVLPNNISINATRNCLVLTQYMIGLVNELRKNTKLEEETRDAATFLEKTEIITRLRTTTIGK